MLGGGQLFGNRQVEPGPAGDQRIGHMPILVEIIGVIAGNVEDERRRVPQFADDGCADKQGRNRHKPHESKSLPSAGRVKRDTPQARSRPPDGNHQQHQGHGEHAHPIDDERYAHVGAGVGDRYDRAAFFLNPNTHDAGTRRLDIMAANSVGIHRLGLAGDAIDIRAHMNGRQRFEDFLIVVRFGFGLGLPTGLIDDLAARGIDA